MSMNWPSVNQLVTRFFNIPVKMYFFTMIPHTRHFVFKPSVFCIENPVAFTKALL